MTDKKIVIDNADYIISSRDFDLLKEYAVKINDILANVHAVEKDEDIINILGEDYKYSLYYNHETRRYGGGDSRLNKACNRFAPSDKASHSKRIMQKQPEFCGLYTLAASVVAQFNIGHRLRKSKWIANPNKENRHEGNVVAGNMIVRNKQTGLLELWSPRWLCVSDFHRFCIPTYDNKDIKEYGLNWFIDSCISDREYRTKLLSGRVR